MGDSSSPITLGRFYSQFQSQFENIYTTINQSLRQKVPVDLRLVQTTSTDGKTAQSLKEDSNLSLMKPLSNRKSNTPKSSSFWPSFSLLYGVKKNNNEKSSNKKSMDKMIRPRPARIINHNPIFTDPDESEGISKDSFLGNQNFLSLKSNIEQDRMEIDDLNGTPHQKQTLGTTAKERLQAAKMKQLEKKIDWLISQQLSTIQHKEILSDLSFTPAQTNVDALQIINDSASKHCGFQNDRKSVNIPPPPPPPPINFVAPKLALSSAPESGQQETPRLKALKSNHTHSSVATSTPPQVMKSLLCEMKQVVLKPVVMGLLEEEFDQGGCKRGPRLNKAQRPASLCNSNHLTQALKDKFLNAGMGEERGEEEDTEVESEWEKE